ncbi:heavy metal translocating P-type ATPase [Parabacteroides merdae]|uniref:P-type Zn(2+) transporter n=1 Tax=Parabacteroides merdae CL03T12C32 TaxID=999420 RepID=K5ZPE4_9BACT|nr:heavy metal translocating P-type ATPase [Parabacteroides merdae]EKN13180.1 heavy metal translocating P-type ATPase [Parabacteroides merdae CL03T12C32]
MEAKTTCHSGCGCGCGHGHNKGEKRWEIALPILSFILLIAGLILDHTGQSWFSPAVKLIWYLTAFLPVGLPVMREAYREALQKDFFTEFSLMSIASIGAFSIGEYPEAVAVMLFYTVGEMLQNKAVERASQNISRLLDVRPERTDVFREGKYINVSPKEVKTGERIEVKPGGRIPLDGILQETEASFDTSALTGESMPRTLRKGDEVLAGMIVLGQAVRIEVNRPYDQSALARILALVKDAAERKAPAELFIRRFARSYTPAVIVLALLIVIVPALAGLVVPSFQYVFHDWLYRGLVFLVISCPCALVISVPLGYFGSIGAASQAGILFKSGNYLDAITRINTVAFDKTGTLTTGRFEVTDMLAHGIPEPELLALLLSVEQKSTHPIAQAIVRYAKKQNISAINISEMHELAGHGMEAIIGGQEVLVGNIRLMTERRISIPEELSDKVATVVICAIGKKYAGHLLLSDTLKDDAVEAIAKLRKLGVTDIRLLSGDKKEIVESFAKRLDIDLAYGNLLPEDKVTHIREMVEEPGKSVAFVGDGMNDAPVLALSHVGIAMGGLGSDAAIESADVVIQNDQPSKVATAIAIGRKTRTIVRQNIIGALGVKGIVLLAGALGYVTLWGAVFADVGVALLAVFNSVRILNRKVW